MVISPNYHPPSSLNQEQTHFNGLAPIHKELIVLAKLIALDVILPDVLQRDNNILNYNVLFEYTSVSFLINIGVRGKLWNYESIAKIHTENTVFLD